MLDNVIIGLRSVQRTYMLWTAARRVVEDNASTKWLPYNALFFANVAGFALNDRYANFVASYVPYD